MAVLDRASASDATLGWLRDQVRTGAWAVGDRIPPEHELVGTIGVGRNTLREAIKSLTATGMLEIRRGEGTFVRSRSELGAVLDREAALADLRTMHEVRVALELQAVALACDRRTDDDLEHIAAALELRSRRGTSTEDIRAYAEFDVRFHFAVVASAHNALLSSLFEGIGPKIRDVYEFNRGAYQPAESDDAHAELFDALRDRDHAAARVAAHIYLAHTDAALDRRETQLKDLARADPCSQL